VKPRYASPPSRFAPKLADRKPRRAGGTAVRTRPEAGSADALRIAMLPSLAVAGSIVKLALSIALTYRTKWWWAPGALMAGVGTLLALSTSPTFGAIVITLGALAFATSAVLRPTASA
jgi:hypothetical protein